MRKVGIRQLRDNLSKELKDLPLAIASDGQIVATILSIEGYKQFLEGYKGKALASSHYLTDNNKPSGSSHKLPDRNSKPLDSGYKLEPNKPGISQRGYIEDKGEFVIIGGVKYRKQQNKTRTT